MSIVLFLVPLAAVAILVLCATALLIEVAVRSRAVNPERWRTSWCTASLPALPAICAALGVIALGVPHPLATCHCHIHGLHHPHLCAVHPELAAPLLWPAVAVLAAWGALVVPRLRGVARSLRDTVRLVRLAGSGPIQSVDDLPVRVLELGTLKAFSVGILRPLIVVDRSLWDLLSNDQRRAVVHHERGHVERKDGLTLLGLRMLAALCPWPFGGGTIDAWRGAAERVCDLPAAAIVRDRSLVAEALLTVERASRSVRPGTDSADLVLGIAEHSDLEARVLALLDERPRTVDVGNDLFALAVIGFGAILLLAAWPGSAFHHGVETLLGLALGH